MKRKAERRIVDLSATPWDNFEDIIKLWDDAISTARAASGAVNEGSHVLDFLTCIAQNEDYIQKAQSMTNDIASLGTYEEVKISLQIYHENVVTNRLCLEARPRTNTVYMANKRDGKKEECRNFKIGKCKWGDDCKPRKATLDT